MPERFATILLPVKKGLHVLRYVSATDMIRPPRVVVMGKPGASEGLSLLFGPDLSENTLVRFDDCVAIRATHPAVLMVTSMTDPLGVSTDVELKLEPVDKPERRSAPRDVTPPLLEAPSGVASRFLVEGHLQKQGDARAGSAGWLGAAGGEERLESFALSWVESIKGVRLSYGCEMPGRGRQVARIPGQAVGTKGQSTPITRVFFELTGSQAAQWEFVVTAAFRGVSPRTASGQKVELAGPTGQEPLTGLKIDLRERSAAAETVADATPAMPAPPANEAAPASAATERGRVRVFRAANLAR